jgi:hypothetical protein
LLESLVQRVTSELAPETIAQGNYRLLDELGVEVEGEPELWSPHPDNIPQQNAFDSDADELFYGGQAGGGKTDLLLGFAFRKHRKSLILRREQTQLTELIDRSLEIAGTALDKCYNATSKRWRGLPGGRSIEFSGCEQEKDKNKFKGRPHDLKGFDELPDFLKSQYTFICAWNRTAIPGQRCQRVSTGNPPTNADGEWIIEYWGPWLDEGSDVKANPGELLYYFTLDGHNYQFADGPEPFDHKGETITPISRTFIPASIADNPYLKRTGYLSTLQSLPEPLRSQLLYGNFKVGREDEPWQLFPTAWIKAAQQRWREYSGGRPSIGSLESVGIDPTRGGTDNTAMCDKYHTKEGPWFSPVDLTQGEDTNDGPKLAALAFKRSLGARGVRYNIDVIGIGSSAYDQMKILGLDVIPITANKATKQTDSTRKLTFMNVRALYHWKLREALDPANKTGIMLPDDKELFKDLAAIKWTVMKGGIKVEDKDEIRNRIGRSPDRAEAVMLANFVGTRSWAKDQETLNKLRGS